MKHLIPYFKKYRLESILAPLFKMLEACFDLAVPLIVAVIIDQGIRTANRSVITSRFFLLIAMALLGLLCSFIAQYFAARAAVGTAAGLREELLQKIHSLSIPELDKVGSSTLITRITSDVNQVQNGVNMLLRLFLRSPFIVFGALVMAISINKTVSLVFAGMITVLFLIVFGIMYATAPLYRQVQERLDDVTEATRENLNGVRVIRAFGREEVEQERFARVNELLCKAQLVAGRVAAAMNPLTYLVVNAGILAVLWMGAGRVNSGALGSGDVIALINYISQILVELVKLANLIILLGKSASGMSRIGQVLDAPSPATQNGQKPGREDAPELLRFQHVSLRYPGAGADSLTDLSFSVRPGETVGVIGGTGSGKTSLAHLITRFYEPTAGTVTLLGEPIRELSRSALLSHVALVDQKPRLFAGTIRSNLLFGNPAATEEELWEALETAQAADFVRQKPEGLDAPVTQGGANLSGGQKQRLTIARALAAKPRLLILDDSASALDYATDAALRRSLSQLPEQVTVLMISQRAGSLLSADHILVLEDGNQAGWGTHEELLKSNPVYQEIYYSQFGKEAHA